MNLSSIVLNKSGLVRSGWRAAVYVLSTIIVTTAALAAFIAAYANLAEPEARGLPTSIATFVIACGSAIFFGWLWGRVFERLPFAALGAAFRNGWLRNFAVGCIVGAASLLFAAGIVVASGNASFSFNSASGTTAIATTLATTFALFFAGAAFEEAFFRGYLLQTFCRDGHWVFGALLTSILFAMVHNDNPGANTLSWTNTFLAGIWFVVAYWKTRDLWFPFGIHLTWNWVQGPVLGINVSGLASLAPDPVLRADVSGPEWLSGGSYGVEASLACTIALVASSVAIIYLPGISRPEKTL